MACTTDTLDYSLKKSPQMRKQRCLAWRVRAKDCLHWLIEVFPNHHFSGWFEGNVSYDQEWIGCRKPSKMIS